MTTNTKAGARGKGRPHGSVNRATLALRTALADRGFDIIDKIITLYESQDFNDKDRMKIARILLEYTHPKPKEIDLVAYESGEAQPKDSTPINISLDELVAIARGDQVE